jgi:hypothetical protein
MAARAFKTPYRCALCGAKLFRPENYFVFFEKRKLSDPLYREYPSIMHPNGTDCRFDGFSIGIGSK